MSIVTARRISQAFFLLLLVWLVIVTQTGTDWWQMGGWSTNWLLQLDPLVALGTLLSTGTLYAGLLWALGTVILTILLGRFFCSWVCPFGTMHHFVGYLARRRKSLAEKVRLNRYRRAQAIKYYLLVFLLTAAAGGLISRLIQSPRRHPVTSILAAAILLALVVSVIGGVVRRRGRALATAAVFLAIWVALSFFLSMSKPLAVSLQIGLLDPIPLVYRSVSLVVLPIVDATGGALSSAWRHYEWAWLIGGVFLAALLLNLIVPRFYCRFICPLGALLGAIDHLAIWRIGKTESPCSNCGRCEANCEGACNPSGAFRISECVLCFNCLHACNDGLIRYQRRRSGGGEISAPDISRRGLLASFVSGLAAVPILRLTGRARGVNWNPAVIRPPGSLTEEQFLTRCIRCGQCMKVCPTNVIQPAGLQAGPEGLWTPILNNRIGTSGCQLFCTACGYICPTAAIRPLSLDEKLGRGEFADAGPIKLGTAFIDRGRCLPWAMGRPCIVCQENCPVSPKAIYTREVFQTVRNGVYLVRKAQPDAVELEAADLPENAYSTGDYYCRPDKAKGAAPKRIVAHTSETITLASDAPWAVPPEPGSRIEIQVRLQRPYVDPAACIGCGVCEHECPVAGRRAIRVTAENESRSPARGLTIQP